MRRKDIDTYLSESRLSVTVNDGMTTVDECVVIDAAGYRQLTLSRHDTQNNSSAYAELFFYR